MGAGEMLGARVEVAAELGGGPGWWEFRHRCGYSAIDDIATVKQFLYRYS